MPHSTDSISKLATRSQLTDTQMMALGQLVDKYPPLWDADNFYKQGYINLMNQYRKKEKTIVWDECAAILKDDPCFDNYSESVFYIC